MPRHRYELDPARSRVSIVGSSTVHPVHAEASGLHGWIELLVTAEGIGATPAVEGEVRIEVDRLKASNPLVQSETRRRIDARRFPEITGRVTASTRIDATQLALAGEITFIGETRPVEGELLLGLDGGELTLTGEQRFDVREWGLQPPRIGLLKVHPTVAVKLTAVATQA